MSNRKCLTFNSNVSHILEDHFYPAFNSTRKCLSIGAGSNVKVSSNFNCPYGILILCIVIKFENLLAILTRSLRDRAFKSFAGPRRERVRYGDYFLPDIKKL